MSIAQQSLVNQYYVGESLSSGRRSSVWLAVDLVELEFVVLKVLNEEFAADPRARKRRAREVDIFKALDHTNIVGFRHAFEYEGQPVLVLEHVRGKRLTRLIDKSNPVTFGQVVRIVEEICSALGHVHSKGILHRNVVPSNIVVALDGESRLLDFGQALSEHQSLQTVPGELSLSEPYAAPEVIRSADHSPVSDLYGLGASLHHALATTSYFSTDYDELLTQKFQPAPSIATYRPDLPEWFAAVIDKLLAVEVEQRYGEAREVLLELGKHALDNDMASESGNEVIGRIRSIHARGKHHDALRLAEIVEQQEPKNAEIKLTLSRINHALGRPQAALRYLESAAFLEKNNPSYAMEYALLLVRERQAGRAQTFLRNVPPAVSMSTLVQVLRQAIEVRDAHPEVLEQDWMGTQTAEVGEGFIDWLKGLWS